MSADDCVRADGPPPAFLFAAERMLADVAVDGEGLDVLQDMGWDACDSRMRRYAPSAGPDDLREALYYLTCRLEARANDSAADLIRRVAC